MLSKPQVLEPPEGLGKLEKVIRLIGLLNRDLSACSIVLNNSATVCP
jgi:hypothetical protein